MGKNLCMESCEKETKKETERKMDEMVYLCNILSKNT